MLSSSLRPSAEKPCPPLVITSPRKCTSISLQRTNAARDLRVGLRVGGLEGGRASRRRTRRRTRTCRRARCARGRRPHAPGPGASGGSRDTSPPGPPPAIAIRMDRLYAAPYPCAPYATTRHSVHRPVGRPTAHRARREGRRLGLRRPRAGLLGRPLRRRRRARGRGLLPRAARAARAPRAERVDDRQPPDRPGRLRPDRRPPPGRRAARRVGRRRPRGRPAASRGQAQGHRARRRAARRDDRDRVHRLADLAHALLASRPTTSPRSSAATSNSPSASPRSSTSSTPKASASRSKSTPPRSPTTSSPPARRSAAIDHREGFGINFDPSHFEHQFLDSAAFVTEFADRIYHVHVKDSIKRLDGRRSILGLALELRRGGARLGLRLPRSRRRRLRGAVPGAEPDRL